jgi:hypothetical protein
MPSLTPELLQQYLDVLSSQAQPAYQAALTSVRTSGILALCWTGLILVVALALAVVSRRMRRESEQSEWGAVRTVAIVMFVIACIVASRAVHLLCSAQWEAIYRLLEAMPR